MQKDMTRPARVATRPTRSGKCAFALMLLGACAVTSHPSEAPEQGLPTTLAALEAVLADRGPVRVQTIASANWQVDRSGLINLNHERARHLKAGAEHIHIYFHALHHPLHGLFMIDTGVARAITDPDNSPISWPVTAGINMNALKVHITTAAWLQEQNQPLRGVFSTHLHLDHIMGLPDIPVEVPIYTGPNEAGAKAFLHMFIKGTNNRLLSGRGPLRVWRFAPAHGAKDMAAVDVFGDATVFALHAPGHTPGSTAFVIRTPEGPLLLVGDACHTRFGWDNEVEPGTFSTDQRQSAESLQALRRLAKRHPNMQVRLGHQSH